MFESKPLLTKEEQEKMDREWKEAIEAAVRWIDNDGMMVKPKRKRGLFG